MADHRVLIDWTLVILWMCFIFFLSNQSTLPGPYEPFWNVVFKKSAHMFVYAVLTILYTRAYRHLRTIAFPFIILGAILSSLLFASLDEYHQSFIPGRTATVRDLGFDAIGTFGATYILIKKKKTILKNVTHNELRVCQKVHSSFIVHEDKN
jgi:VanZ family protein